MCELPVPQRRRRIVLGSVWGLCLALWTAALLTSFPAEANRQLLPAEVGSPLSKVVHVAAYGFLTALLGWMRPAPLYRWALLALLSLHTFATEWLQTYVPQRSGSLQDVLIDHAGIVLGAVLSYSAWTARA